MASFAVDSSAAVLVHGPQDIGDVIIRNTGASTVYLGPDSTVTSATGLSVAAGASIQVWIEHAGRSIYAICAAAASTTVEEMTF